MKGERRRRTERDGRKEGGWRGGAVACHLSRHVTPRPFPRDRNYGKLIVTLYAKLRGKGSLRREG